MGVERRDTGFAQILDPTAKFEEIAADLHFTEGPIWHPHDHYLIFSDIIGNTQYRWDESRGLSVWRQPSQMANGNTYDREGRVLTCEHASSRVSRTDQDGNYQVLASHYEGKEFHSPNDIVVKSDGAIYFTDPDFGRSEPFGVAREQELSFQGVYRLDPKSHAVTLLVDDFAGPNGLCFSLDERQLFVNDTRKGHIRVFDVQADGTLGNGRIWAEVQGEGEGVADGMKLDQAGNLYSCGPGGIHVFDPAATLLGVIRPPTGCANFTWGDADLCTLYITAVTKVLRIRVKSPGRPAF